MWNAKITEIVKQNNGKSLRVSVMFTNGQDSFTEDFTANTQNLKQDWIKEEIRNRIENLVSIDSLFKSTYTGEVDLSVPIVKVPELNPEPITP